MSEQRATNTDTERALFQIHIRGSIQEVWRQITKTDEPQETFFNMYMDAPGGTLAVGNPICMRTKSRKYTGAVGRVLEFDPPHRYAHTFRFTHLDDPECVVIYDLQEVDGGVDFRLTLENLPVGTKTEKQMRRGGPMIIKTLKAMVERGRPPLATRTLFALFRAMEFTSPASTRSELWPLES